MSAPIHRTSPTIRTSRCFAAACIVATSGLAYAQVPRSTLPASSVAQPMPTQASAAVHTAQNGVRPAEVRYINGMLSVSARDSSLNGILGEIARQTGMRITGSVREDRVFGNYGPDRPSVILSTLLDGTGSNMLFVAANAGKPQQLVLTPRVGAPTPPSQFAADRQSPAGGPDDNGAQPPAGPNQFPQQPFGGPPRSMAGAPADQQAGQSLNPPLSPPTNNNSDSQTVVFPSVNATTTPATATTSSDNTQQDPGGIKTPQQIFEQLQQLRQQQEQTDPGTVPQQ